MSTYDESRIRSALDQLPATGKVTFASACAEWLYPIYEEFGCATGLGDAAALRVAIDMAWGLARGAAEDSHEVRRQQSTAESLIPSDDSEDSSVLSPLAQNAAAGAAYALRSWLADDAQDAVWAARQMYEANDYMVQLGSALHSYVDADDVEEPTTMVVGGILRALEHAGENAVDRAHEEAAAGGRQLRELWTQGPTR